MRTLTEIVRKEISSEKLDSLIQRQQKAGRDVELLHYIITEHDFSCRKFGYFEVYNSQMKNCCFAAAEFMHPVFGEIFGTGLDFSCAVLGKGEIIWSKLPEACFAGARLVRMYFFENDLSGADFSNADLTAANFIDCNLDGANFENAKTDKTRFENCSMKNCKGLSEKTEQYKPVMFSGRNC